MISLCNISKILGDFSLENIDLDVPAGQYFVLLGPSGVGKTVLLEIAAGLLGPDAGSVHLGGRDITALPPERRGMALVYQDYALFPHLDVLANVTYGLRARSVPRAAARAKALEALRVMGVGELSRRDTGTLSGGEKQRVALARAIVTEPRVLLLDEPLAAIDRDESERLRRVLKETQRQRGITCLHVTHNVDEALYLADSLGVMLDGTMAQSGGIAEVFESPKDERVARFLGLRNVFAVDSFDEGTATVRGAEIRTGFQGNAMSNLWIRPEDVLLSAAPFDSSARNQFECRVDGWERQGRLYEVRLVIGEFVLVSLITQSSFEEMRIEPGLGLYCTFKSTAVHCF